jgi:DNA-binding transcriptional ArsR family regulator
MTKVSLDLDSFKALASETRLDILRTLDGKKMSLKDITKATNLHKMTLYEHLSKLVTAGFIKRIEREGHKWVYYKLTWKGSSLLHPENTRIVVMFSITLVSLFFGLGSFIAFMIQEPVKTLAQDIPKAVWSNRGDAETVFETTPEFCLTTSPLFLYTAIACITVFISLLVVSIWRYRKNKPQKL